MIYFLSAQDGSIYQGDCRIGDRQATDAEVTDQLKIPVLLDFISTVKSNLSSTDIVITRITEAVAMNKTSWSTADVQAYLAYREILRTLLKATTVSELPTKPPFPANT